ncbi:polysaccharide pyruvyl transferase family protein [Cryobacterium sp.]|uniref:polysaccharide pyruvyl transferase family protein n=1 Tax=Cryobacterium sp. TaxID=1926290 RepID=UPI002604ABC7|nr:polysaccharide pyruvyl transferase family protein [Cryobacterium sp.]MCU1444483.1 Polysaccharide pyruvyl transferase family protein WcaK [Cryobacterium sp.]
MKVFASAMGQVDNVGDTVLRRAFLNAIRPAGDLQVYVGSRDDSYLSGLGLAPGDGLFRRSDEWRREISRTTWRAPVLYAFNAGEMELQRSYAMHYLRLAPLLVASKLRGGHAVHAGLGIRTRTAWRYPIAATLRLCDVVSWRDSYSRASMGLGTVAPDWAFALGSSDDQLSADTADRPLLAVSVRYTGERPDDTWVRNVRGLASALGLQIVTVAQILRDGPLAQELAVELGGEAHTWNGPNHATQEATLRALYRRSSLVVTDRLHAAVIALTEGALPLGLADSPTAKVTRTLGAAGIHGAGIDRRLPDAAVLHRTARDVLARREPILRHVIDARAALAALTHDIRNLTS